MEQLEMIEKLSKRAEVSYDEAREALEACDWDILEAMVYLEKQGKAKAPSQETYSTHYEDQTQYVSVREKVEDQKSADNDFWQKLGKFAKMLLKKSQDNYFCVHRHHEQMFQIPVWAFVLVIFWIWEIIVPLMIVGLFFDFHYSFCGKDNLNDVNKAMEKASHFADKVRDEFEKM